MSGSKSLLFPLLALAALTTTPIASAATFIANSSLDMPDNNPGDGLCRSDGAPPSLCSLRAAIMEANALPGLNVIQLQAGRTYTLTRQGVDDSALNGDLDIAKAITIECENCVESRAVVDASGIDRAFHLVGGGSGNVRFQGFDITGGDAAGAFGGGILNAGSQFDVHLREMRLYGNLAHRGGAVYNAANTSMFIVLSEFHDNHGDGQLGAVGNAINNLGSLALVASTLSNNGWGDLSASPTIGAGGPYTLLRNTTVSGNAFHGIAATDGELDIRNATLVDNEIGVLLIGSDRHLVLRNSIVARNRSSDCFLGTGNGADTDGNNLISDDSCSHPSDTTNLVAVEPLLMPLRRRFGQAHTPVHWPRFDSPALSAGATAGVGDLACQTLDQNGTARPQGHNGIVRCDIGSAEVPDDAIYFDSLEIM